jgi:hypothetical protein
MKRFVLLSALLALVALALATPAEAACWRLANGQIVETNSNSTPPVYGAVRISCPAPNFRLPTERAGISFLTESPDPRECVAYARSRVRGLPSGLFSMADKRRIINDSRARAGSIAIINASSYGHVAYVEEVTSTSITISETNFHSGMFTRRRAVGSTTADAERQLHIEGYFRP